MNANKKLWISVNGPEYRGAPYPEFDPLKINESAFEDDLRGKEWAAYICDGVGYVKWLSQLEEHATDKWDAEVMRAFKANGLKNSAIHVCFGSRDTGYVEEYDIAVGD